MIDEKTLYLMRHAEAGWQKREQHDFSRSLTPEGKSDAQKMGQWLRANNRRPSVIFSSPAQRALQTAALIGSELSIPSSKIIIEKKLYEATAATLLELIKRIDEQISSALIIGHNPALTRAINKITSSHINHAPSGSIATIRISSHHWEDLEGLGTELQSFDYP